MGSLIALLIIIWLIYVAARSIFCSGGSISPDGTMICQNCGTRGETKTVTKGSIFIEVILWICFIIPGLVYSIWRMTTKYQACPACGQQTMIGINTPNGQLLIKGKAGASAE